MPTSTHVDELKINKLTQAQFDAAVQGGTIGANELSIITDMDVDSIQVSTMPTAAAGELGKVYQFIGTTGTYTHGYFYECVSDGGNPATYSWARVDVQPAGSSLPSQTGNSGKFLTTDGTDASWGNALVNNTTTYDGTAINTPSKITGSGMYNVLIGKGFRNNSVYGNGRVVIGGNTVRSGALSVAIGSVVNLNEGNGEWSVAIGEQSASNDYAVGVGPAAKAKALGAIQLGSGTNTTAGTLSVGLVTSKSPFVKGNYELLSSDGTIPTDRFTTTPSADGTYYPTLSISSGTPTRSWSTIAALQNTATGTSGLGILGTTSGNQTVVIGDSADGSSYSGVVIEGYNARATSYSSVAIGSSSSAHQSAVAVGKSAAALGVGSIQLGQGTNNTAGTFQVGLTTNGYSWTQYELLSSDGTIPADRYTTTPSVDGTYVPTLTISSGVATRSWSAPSGAPTTATATLAVNDWSSNTQTVNVTGVTANNLVQVAPAPSSNSDYVSGGVLCTAQGVGTLTFTCTTTPTNAITVNVVIFG